MLHIILLLLKIIGWILLAILGILILLILVVLFGSFKYNLQGSASGTVDSIKANVTFSWFFRTIRGFVQYEQNELKYNVYVLWKKVASADQQTATEELQKQKEEADEKKAVHIVSNKPVNEIKNESVTEVSNESVKGITENEPVKTDEVKDESKPEEKIGNKIAGLYQKISHKISQIYNKIKCTIQKICDKMKKLSEIKEKVQNFIEDEVHIEAFHKLIREVKRLLSYLKPKNINANLHFGFDDPYMTGQVLAGAAIIYPFTEEHLHLEPDFEQAVLEGDVYIKGRIRVIYFVIVGLQLLLNKNVRKTYKDIRKLMK